MRWSVSFFLGSKRNRKFKDLVQTKRMCENTITNLFKKVSVGGSTSLKEIEKKVYESWCKENNSQQAEESKPNILYLQNISPLHVKGHRGINFLNDYDEADKEERR